MWPEHWGNSKGFQREGGVKFGRIHCQRGEDNVLRGSLRSLDIHQECTPFFAIL